jgi:hypothetical protein
MMHKHPGFWGTSHKVFADRPAHGDEKIRYWGHACRAPFCPKVWFDPSFYNDAADEDLVAVAEKLAKLGHELHVPDQRLARVAPPRDDTDFRSPPAQEDTRRALDHVAERVRRETPNEWNHMATGWVGECLSIFLNPLPGGFSFQGLFLRGFLGMILGPLVWRLVRKGLAFQVPKGFWPFS